MGLQLILDNYNLLEQTASVLDLDWTILAAQLLVESAGNPEAIGKAGEIGLAQIMPTTAADFGITNTDDLKDPKVNIAVQGLYLAWIRDYLVKFGATDIKLIFSAYNWGIGNVMKHLKQGGTFETIPERVREGYVNKIYKVAEELKEKLKQAEYKGNLAAS
jgi:soluble lytic murein transglycosylase-like protein